MNQINKFIKISLASCVILSLANANMVRNDKQGVVFDSETNLMWQDNSDTKTVKKNWQGAIDYCENLNLAGYDDWRLPDKDTLQALEPKRSGLENVNIDFYWSSSPAVSTSILAQIVLLGSGFGSLSKKSDSNFVRCVRDSKPLNFDGSEQQLSKKTDTNKNHSQTPYMLEKDEALCSDNRSSFTVGEWINKQLSVCKDVTDTFEFNEIDFNLFKDNILAGMNKHARVDTPYSLSEPNRLYCGMKADFSNTCRFPYWTANFYAYEPKNKIPAMPSSIGEMLESLGLPSGILEQKIARLYELHHFSFEQSDKTAYLNLNFEGYKPKDPQFVKKFKVTLKNFNKKYKNVQMAQTYSTNPYQDVGTMIFFSSRFQFDLNQILSEKTGLYSLRVKADKWGFDSGGTVGNALMKFESYAPQSRSELVAIREKPYSYTAVSGAKVTVPVFKVVEFSKNASWFVK